MASVIQDIIGLANTLTLTPQEFRHVLLLENIEVQSGKAVDVINYSIPLYNGLVVTNLQLQLTTNNGELVSTSGAMCQWLANQQSVTAGFQASAKGEIFQAFGDGDNISLRVSIPNLKSKCTLNVRASCFLIPSSKTQILINNSTIALNQNGKGRNVEVIQG